MGVHGRLGCRVYLRQTQQDRGWLGWCPPFRGTAFPGSGAEIWPGCEAYANFVFDYFERTSSIRLVIVAGDWQRYEPTYEGNVLKQIAGILAMRGGRMVLVTAVPNPRGDLPRVWARAQVEAGHGIPKMTVHRSQQEDIVNQGNRIATIARERGNVITVDPFHSLCNPAECFTVKEGRGLFKDTDHLTQEGVSLVAPELAATIRGALVAIGLTQQRNSAVAAAHRWRPMSLF
jgi:SGNH domain (fused to AT3 domains)